MTRAGEDDDVVAGGARPLAPSDPVTDDASQADVPSGTGAVRDIALDRLPTILETGRNCWRIVRADRAAVVVDAADYYHYIREAMESATRRITLIGWDFDTRISLEVDPMPSGRLRQRMHLPPRPAESLGRFFLRLARERPQRDIIILKWNFGALKQFLRPSTALMLLRWKRTRAIRFKFDSAHPVGCSHHQKIVVIDDSFAVCGGIDISTARWDRSAHADDEPLRRLPGGRPYPPWHDVTMLVDGPIARALSDLGHERWLAATGRPLDPIEPGPSVWPDDLAPQFRDVDIAIARTRAPFRGASEVREVEALYLDLIASAQRFIYIENQYLTSAKIAAAIAARFQTGRPIDVVVVMPRSADGWLEQKAMDAARVQLARAIGKVDTNNRFRIYVPVTKGKKDIYVHAKVTIVDDRILRVGSANLNNRSLGLDSECDLVIDTALPANAEAGPVIASLRTRLMAEHLGVASVRVADAFARTGSIIDTIDALLGTHDDKTLDLLEVARPGALDQFIADNELLDPEHAAGFFEPLGKRGLWRNWRKGRQ